MNCCSRANFHFLDHKLIVYLQDYFSFARARKRAGTPTKNMELIRMYTVDFDSVVIKFRSLQNHNVCKSFGSF